MVRNTKMKSLNLTAVLLLFVLAQIEQTSSMACGRLLSKHNPLGGDDNDILVHWPWLAAIFYHGDKPVPDFLCGGTVITSYTILTAAHCVARFNDTSEKAKISVSLGRLNLSAREGWAQSFEVIRNLSIKANSRSHKK